MASACRHRGASHYNMCPGESSHYRGGLRVSPRSVDCAVPHTLDRAEDGCRPSASRASLAAAPCSCHRVRAVVRSSIVIIIIILKAFIIVHRSSCGAHSATRLAGLPSGVPPHTACVVLAAAVRVGGCRCPAHGQGSSYGLHRTACVASLPSRLRHHGVGWRSAAAAS